MTQVTTIAESGDQVVIAPGWIKRIAGFLVLFSGIGLSLLLIFSGATGEGLAVGGITLFGLPALSLIWRFYWYVVTIFLSLFILLGLVMWWGVNARMLSLPKGWEGLQTIILNGEPISILFAMIVTAIVSTALYRLYTLWQMGALGRLRWQMQDRDRDPFFDFETREPSSSVARVSLLDRVLAHLVREGHRGELQGGLIHVYKRRDFVGIVRVVESAGAISPLIVKDVERHRAKLGVKVAYLATAGWFTDEVRQMANDLGIKLITV
jgi:hypothetical protein